MLISWILCVYWAYKEVSTGVNDFQRESGSVTTLKEAANCLLSKLRSVPPLRTWFYGDFTSINSLMWKLRVVQQHLVSYGLLTAKKLILLFWKKKDVPTVKLWLTETLHLERISFILRNKLGKFEKIWQPVLSYLTG